MTTSGRALSMAAISRAAAAIRSGVSLIVIALVAVIGEICRDVDDDAQQVDRFLEVGVAQIERADDLFLVFAALGRRVRDDRDRARRGDAVERARCGRDRRQRVVERGVAQIDRDRRLAERGVEHDVDPGETRDRHEDGAAARGANSSESGSLASAEDRAGRREIASSVESVASGNKQNECFLSFS